MKIKKKTEVSIAKIRTEYSQNEPTPLSLRHPTRYISTDTIFIQEAGIATGYGLDDRGVGVRVPVESRIFSFPRRPRG
jgi:hypothetical protein